MTSPSSPDTMSDLHQTVATLTVQLEALTNDKRRLEEQVTRLEKAQTETREAWETRVTTVEKELCDMKKTVDKLLQSQNNQPTPPSSPTPPSDSSWSLRASAEKRNLTLEQFEELQKGSEFDVGYDVAWGSSPLPDPSSPPYRPVPAYPIERKPCPHIDVTTGVYHTPTHGLYRFKVYTVLKSRVRTSGVDVVLAMREKGQEDVTRNIAISENDWMFRYKLPYRYSPELKFECGEGAEIWVEISGLPQGNELDHCGFSGGLEE